MECYETGAIDLNENQKREWNFKNDKGELDLYEGDCDHDDYDIVDSECDSPFPDDVL